MRIQRRVSAFTRQRYTMRRRLTQTRARTPKPNDVLYAAHVRANAERLGASEHVYATMRAPNHAAQRCRARVSASMLRVSARARGARAQRRAGVRVQYGVAVRLRR